MQLPANGPLGQAQGQSIKPALGHGRAPVAPRDGGAVPQRADARAASQTGRETPPQIVNTGEFDRNAPRGTYLNIVI